MLPTAIHKHVDVMEDMQDEMSKKIDSVFNRLNIDNIVNDIEGGTNKIIEELRKVVIGEFTHQAIDEGLAFARVVEGHRGKFDIQDATKPEDARVNKDEF